MSLRKQWLLSILIVLLTAAWLVGRQQNSSSPDLTAAATQAASTPSPGPSPSALPHRSPATLREGRLLPRVDPGTHGPHAFAYKNGDGTPVTWSPCQPIRYEVNPDQMPVNGMQVLHAAVEQVSAATGLKFVQAPPSHDLPSDEDTAQRLLGDGSTRPVLIGWETEKQDPTLAGDVAGATNNWRIGFDRAKVYKFVGGSVVLDADLFYLLAHNGEASQEQAIVMHELGHLVGLAHVNDPTEVMNPDAGALHFGPGDREGLAEAGSGPCTF